MNRIVVALVATGLVGTVAACGESAPTALDPQLLPLEPRTVEVVLPWSDFGESVQVFGGYGEVNDLLGTVVANEYRDTLVARSLVRFGFFPSAASVRDSTGTTRTDTLLTFVGGRVVARIDTVRSRVEGPVELALLRLDQSWHAPSASWQFRVDTIGVQEAWAEPGAGPAAPLTSAVWDPASGDSVVFQVDSATVALWGDTAVARPTARVDMVTPGQEVEILGVDLRLITRPSINQDTLVDVNVSSVNRTFVYDPFPEPLADGIRVGGAPAWRTVLTLDVPTVLDGPASLCDQVGCPFALDPDRLNHASIIFRSRASSPSAFQPTDSVLLDARPVLVPDRLPKAPLGPSFLGIIGRAVGPDAFGDQAGEEIAVPITDYLRSLVDPEVQDRVSRDLALLSLLEPSSVGYADFEGPGSPGEPRLRLIVTASDTVEIR